MARHIPAVTVGTTPTLIVDQASSVYSDFKIRSTGIMSIGGPDVTTTDGYAMNAGEEINLQGLRGQLYAITKKTAPAVQAYILDLRA